MTATSTADITDAHPDAQVAVAQFRSFGGREAFFGPISTVKVFEDNSLVRAALEEPGNGRVLIVDGGASQRCALVGDRLAALAHGNGWAGIVVYGCIRDAAIMKTIDVGIVALGTSPKKSIKRGQGTRDAVVRFAGVRWAPGAYAYADEDGVIVLAEPAR